jgi:hypothetical protein
MEPLPTPEPPEPPAPPTLETPAPPRAAGGDDDLDRPDLGD